MRPALERSSSSGRLEACTYRVPPLKKPGGLSPLRRPRPASLGSSPRPARPSSARAAYGREVFVAAQNQLNSLADALGFQSSAEAVQAALAATAEFLQRLLCQVWLAAMAMYATATIAEQQAAVAAAAAAAAASTEEDDVAVAVAAPPSAQLPSPLELMAAATSGAVERLRHTLCDASCSLETKWTALEGTVGSTMSSLFHATSKSAQALNSLGPDGAAAAPARAWQEQATREVLQHEEQLYQQVFVQVYGELLSKDNRQISYSSS